MTNVKTFRDCIILNFQLNDGDVAREGDKLDLK